VNRCHICERPCVREVEPGGAFGQLPAVLEPDVWRVIIRNGLLCDVCHPCWMLWPDPWKHFPLSATAAGRTRIAYIGPR
jgi:hypothetical protein